MGTRRADHFHLCERQDLPSGRRGVETATPISFKQGDNFNCDLERKEGNYLLSGMVLGGPPRPAALPAEAPTRPRAASSALRALLLEVCGAEAWDAAARGTVAESRVIARAARPLDAPARFQGHRTLWKLRGDLALHLNEESWSKGGVKPRKPSREGVGPKLPAQWER